VNKQTIKLTNEQQTNNKQTNQQKQKKKSTNKNNKKPTTKKQLSHSYHTTSSLHTTLIPSYTNTPYIYRIMRPMVNLQARMSVAYVTSSKMYQCNNLILKMKEDKSLQKLFQQSPKYPLDSLEVILEAPLQEEGMSNYAHLQPLANKIKMINQLIETRTAEQQELQQPVFSYTIRFVGQSLHNFRLALPRNTNDISIHTPKGYIALDALPKNLQSLTLSSKDGVFYSTILPDNLAKIYAATEVFQHSIDSARLTHPPFQIHSLNYALVSSSTNTFTISLQT
jgi:hypothetical protein